MGRYQAKASPRDNLKLQTSYARYATLDSHNPAAVRKHVPRGAQ